MNKQTHRAKGAMRWEIFEKHPYLADWQTIYRICFTMVWSCLMLFINCWRNANAGAMRTLICVGTTYAAIIFEGFSLSYFRRYRRRMKALMRAFTAARPPFP